jgi:hypothetical protein
LTDSVLFESEKGEEHMECFQPEVISLKNHPQLNEQWLQDQISENPEILGLGELVLKDRERPQPGAGRLDLLLQDPETQRRYEVEIQLGKTDESHIIRTIEYWDIERRRYPQYEHCAVIVAEEITSRFLNVISLFNGFIPLIALKLQAISVDGRVGLLFTTVLDELPLGLVDEDEDVQEAVTRAYWEQRGSPRTVENADQMLQRIRSFAEGYELKYNKHYIGLAKDGQANNFVVFKPRKDAMHLELKLEKAEETTNRLEEAGLELLEYNRRNGRYRIRLSTKDIEKHGPLLTDLMREAYQARVG